MSRVGALLELAGAIPGVGKLGKVPDLIKLGKHSDEAADAVAAFCSFSADTKVLMADGSTKAISNVEVGDEVLATDPEVDAEGGRAVTHVWVHDDEIIDLAVESGIISTTEDHPFWSATDQQWQSAAELEPGEQLLSPEGASLTVVGPIAGTQRVEVAFNLTVADLHTYYVLAGNTPVLVHNTDPAVPPIVTDPKLQNFVNSLYKGVNNPHGLVGDGTAMGAANSEFLGGDLVERRNHLTSTSQYRAGLNNWLTNNPTASASDRRVAQGLISAIDDAHAGVYQNSSKYPGLGGC